MFKLIICLILFGIFLQSCFIKFEHDEKYVLAVIFKGLASLMFVAIGYIAFTRTNNILAQKMFYGLIFGMLGDICLNLCFVFKKISQIVFLVGILFFFIGHILYLLSLLIIARQPWVIYCVIIGLIISISLLIYIFKTMEVKLAFKIFDIFYLSAVIVMTSIAAGIMIAYPSKASIMYFIGALLFTLADIVLIFNTFSGKTKFSLRITNLSLYYIGQILIACSLLF